MLWPAFPKTLRQFQSDFATNAVHTYGYRLRFSTRNRGRRCFVRHSVWENQQGAESQPSESKRWQQDAEAAHSRAPARKTLPAEFEGYEPATLFLMKRNRLACPACDFRVCAI
jgi:hypothetical protein